jgi:hypothetical protein
MRRLIIIATLAQLSMPIAMAQAPSVSIATPAALCDGTAMAAGAVCRGEVLALPPVPPGAPPWCGPGVPQPCAIPPDAEHLRADAQPVKPLATMAQRIKRLAGLPERPDLNYAGVAMPLAYLQHGGYITATNPKNDFTAAARLWVLDHPGE